MHVVVVVVVDGRSGKQDLRIKNPRTVMKGPSLLDVTALRAAANPGHQIPVRGRGLFIAPEGLIQLAIAELDRQANE